VTWPGHLPAGRTYAQPVISLDVLPIALTAAGVGVPHRLHFDRVNLLPYLIGQHVGSPHEALFWRYEGHRAIRHGKWKLTMPAGEPAGLYDLSSDLAESKDLSAAHPEVVVELTRLYAGWNAELQLPRWRDLFMRDAPGPALKPRRRP
jgi:arylsulfatase A-like enzyme